MTSKEIIALQKRIGTVPDGFWGPASTAAAQAYLRSLMPAVSPWPKPDQTSLTAFFGQPGDESRLVNLDVGGVLMLYDGKPVKTVRCHCKVADSLKRILTAIHRSQWRYVLSDYAGCYNNRPMRGGSLPSLHARGAAIDLRPATNGNRVHWPTKADMPIEVCELFAVEGWLAAGPFWSRDGMHFQATS